MEKNTKNKERLKKLRKERGELAKKILKILVLSVAVGAIGVMVLAAPNTAQLLKFLRPKNNRERYSMRRSIKQLERKHLLSVKKDGVYLTKEGVARGKFYSLEDVSIKRQKRWDGLWRIVFFDIPERKRNVRRALRLKLDELGFYAIQDSVLAIPYPCEQEIDAIREFFFCYNQEIITLETSRVDIRTDRALRKHFGL